MSFVKIRPYGKFILFNSKVGVKEGEARGRMASGDRGKVSMRYISQ